MVAGAGEVLGDREIVRALRALGDTKRFRMMQEVAAAGELSCGQLVERFALAQPTISHHVKILVDAGLLLVRQESKHHFVSVNHDFVKRVAAFLPGVFDGVEAREPA
ncbi:MAG TPA: metalloregulator ArsR/SmtB family transcription factor [Polyangiaceae bacterium]